MSAAASILAYLGLDRSGFASSARAAETEGKSLARTLSSALSGIGIGLGAGAAVAALTKVVDKAHEIHHEAERFGIDAQQLQTIGNAAEEEGIALESVARSMSHLIFAEDEAAKGNTKMKDAFAALKINTQDFQKLNPEQKMLALADALKKGGLNTETYSAAAELLGKRFGTELIPVLLQGGDAIKDISKQMGVMSTETVNKLDTAYKIWKTFWNQIVVASADSLSTVVDEMKIMGASANAIWAEMRDAGVTTWKMISRAAALDFKGVDKAWKDGWEQMKNDAEKSSETISNLGKKIKKDYINVAKDWVSVVTETAKAADTKPAAPGAGAFQTEKPKAPGIVIAERPSGNLEDRFEDEQELDKKRFASGPGSIAERWVGEGSKPKGGGTEFEKALNPIGLKLDKIEHNTQQQFVNE
jgi:hypothetical protein